MTQMLDFALGETADAIRETTRRYASERIAPIREFIELGGQSLPLGVIGAGYWGPSANESVLTATDVEKQIGDRLVVDDQSPEEVLAFALETINAAM